MTVINFLRPSFSLSTISTKTLNSVTQLTSAKTQSTLQTTSILNFNSIWLNTEITTTLWNSMKLQHMITVWIQAKSISFNFSKTLLVQYGQQINTLRYIMSSNMAKLSSKKKKIRSYFPLFTSCQIPELSIQESYTTFSISSQKLAVSKLLFSPSQAWSELS